MMNNPYRQQIVSMLAPLNKKQPPPISRTPPVMKPPVQQVQPPPVKRGY